jgi:hypothetical protein
MRKVSFQTGGQGQDRRRNRAGKLQTFVGDGSEAAHRPDPRRAGTWDVPADGTVLDALSGPVRDHTPFLGAFDPYETPDFLFVGDDTTSAKAAFSLRRVEILPASAALVLRFVAPASGTGLLTFSWPTGHKLQRATTVSPADWQDAPGDPPLAVLSDEADGYFRVVPR